MDEVALEKYAVVYGHYLNVVIPVTLNHLVLSGNRRAINHPPVKNSSQFHNYLKTDGRNF